VRRFVSPGGGGDGASRSKGLCSASAQAVDPSSELGYCELRQLVGSMGCRFPASRRIEALSLIATRPIMLSSLQRWFQVAFLLTAGLTANQSWAGTTSHGTHVLDVGGVNASGDLMGGMGFSATITYKWTANTRTGKYTAHATGQVTNQSGIAHTFEDEIVFLPAGPPTTDLHTTYTVKANGHCTLKITATIVAKCVEPANDETLPAGSLPKPSAQAGALAAGRDAIPSQKQCLASVGLCAGLAIQSTDR
jgi:hypothetical protein